MRAFLAAFAVMLWVLWCLAIWSMIVGNPTAINGVIGCGIMAVLLTALAVLAPD